jgi:hypothetical protein
VHGPSVIGERIEHAGAVVEPECFRDDDDIGVEGSDVRGDVEATEAISSGATDAPVCVERRDREGVRAQMPMRCASSSRW